MEDSMKPLQRSAQAGISAQGTEERTVQSVQVGYRLDRSKPGLVNGAPVQQTLTLTIDECRDWLWVIPRCGAQTVAVSKRQWGYIRYYQTYAEIEAKRTLCKVRTLRRCGSPSDLALIPQYQRELRKQLTIAALCGEALKSYALETAKQRQEQRQERSQGITFIDEADPEEVFERLEKFYSGVTRG